MRSGHGKLLSLRRHDIKRRNQAARQKKTTSIEIGPVARAIGEESKCRNGVGGGEREVLQTLSVTDRKKKRRR